MVRIIRPWIPARHKGSLSDYLIVPGKITETRAIEEYSSVTEEFHQRLAEVLLRDLTTLRASLLKSHSEQDDLQVY